MTTCSRCGSETSASDVRCARCGEDLRDITNGLTGKLLMEKYRIEERLGSGGMCDVYRATHEAMGKQVAVKTLKPALAADPTIAQRFEQEARAASLIHHPHAINVMDYGIAEDNVPFIVMEFVRGITLGELLRKEGAQSVERTADILRQASGALDAAHAVGVVHRDIKPDNIIIAEYDGSDWVEVVDFGVAKVLEDVNRRGSLTGANIIVGTPRYMSPEQCEEKPVDARSDIYSLGIVLYEMLSGEAPFKGDSSTRLLVAHASEPPEPLRNKRPDLSPEVESVVMRSLEKDPALRPQSAGEFAGEFLQAAGLGQSAQIAASRAGAFSRISVPLGENDQAVAPVAAQAPGGEDQTDESTIVRPRPSRASSPQSDTPVQQQAGLTRELERSSGEMGQPVAPVFQQNYATPAGGVTYVSHASQKRGNNAGIIALVGLLLAVAGVAAYLVFANKGFGRSSTSESVFDAQQAVTEAIARVDSLPKDHPLRSYMSDLQQWQGELRAYQEVREENRQVSDKADRYKQKATEISDQARVAQTALGREPAAPRNISAPPPQSPPPAGQAKEGDTGGTEDAADAEKADEKESETPVEKENLNANKNTVKPRSAVPPVLDPVRPSSETEPKNSNKQNKNSPPAIEKVGQNDN